MKESNCNNGLQEMLTQAINQMKADYGEKFDIEHINLAYGVAESPAKRSRKSGGTEIKVL